MEKLASALYLLVHSRSENQRYDINDASADKLYSILVSKSTVSVLQSSRRGNIVHQSWTGKHKHIERLRCTACDREFSEREGTCMARGELPETTVAQLLNVSGGASVMRVPPISAQSTLKTVHRFQSVAAHRAQTHQQQVVQQGDVQGVQLDEAHAKLRPRQIEWSHTALAMGSWCLLWVDFGPRPQGTAAALIAQVVARAQALPLLPRTGGRPIRRRCGRS